MNNNQTHRDILARLTEIWTSEQTDDLLPVEDADIQATLWTLSRAITAVMYGRSLETHVSSCVELLHKLSIRGLTSKDMGRILLNIRDTVADYARNEVAGEPEVIQCFFDMLVIKTWQADTSRLRQERALAQEWAARLERLQTITRAVVADLGIDSVLQTIVDQVCEYSPWTICCILTIDQDKNEMEIAAQHGLGPNMVKGYRFDGTGSVTVAAVKYGWPIIIQDVNDCPDFPRVKQHAQSEGYCGLVSIPLPLDDQTMVINVYSEDTYSFSTHDLTYVSALADQAAIAISNAHVFGKVQHQNNQLRQAVEDHGRMLQMVLEGRELQHIAMTLSRVLHVPLAVVGQFDHPLALAPDSMRWRDVDLRTLRQQRFGVRIFPLQAGDDILGYLLIRNGHRQVTNLEQMVMEQGALALALELLKEKTAFEVELRLRADFLSDLLAGDHAAAHERGTLLGYDLSQATDLLVLEIDRRTNVAESIETLRSLVRPLQRMLSRLDPDAMIVTQGNRIVVLLPRSTADDDQTLPTREIATRLQEEASQLLTNIMVSIGQGRRCYSLADYGLSLKEARRALAVARSLGRTGEVVSIETLGLYGILFREDDPDEVKRFIRQTLDPLLASEHQNGADFIKTLDAYMQENGHLRATARRLSIHVNTLLYRLQRIEEIAGIDVREDPDERLNVQLALKLLQISSRLGGDVTLPPSDKS